MMTFDEFFLGLYKWNFVFYIFSSFFLFIWLLNKIFVFEELLIETYGFDPDHFVVKNIKLFTEGFTTISLFILYFALCNTCYFPVYFMETNNQHAMDKGIHIFN